MAKRQKSFFERLTELNDRHDEKHDKNTTNKAKRNKATIAIGATIFVGIVAAITIPLTINVTKINYKDAIDNKTPVVKYLGPDGKELNSTTAGTLQELVNSKDVTVSKEIDDFYHRSIEYLYEQEYKASQEFQRIWNASLLSGESVNNSIALKSLSDIKKDAQAKIDDLKSNLKKNYGFENWEKQFNEIISKEEYGKSLNEAQAVSYLVFKQIESEAQRRYQLEYKKQTMDYINRTANTTIYKLDENGNQIKDTNGQPIVLFNKGDKVFPYFKEGVNYFVDPNNKNNVTTLLTKSFVVETKMVDGKVTIVKDLKSPTPFIENYFNKNKIVLPTVYKLAGKTNKSDIYQPWILGDDKEKSTLANLLKYSVIPNGNKFEIKSNMSILLGMKTAQDYAMQAQGQELNAYNNAISEYQTYLGALTQSDASTLGTSGLTSAEELLATSIDQGLGIFATAIFGNNQVNNIPSIELGKLTEITAASTVQPAMIAAYTKILKEAQAAETMQEAIAKVNEFNKVVDTVVANIKTADMTTFFKQFYNWDFAVETSKGNAASKKVPVVLKVSDMENAYVLLTDKDVLLARYNQINSLEDFKAFITKDAQNYAAGNKTYFNVTNKLSTKVLPEIIVNGLVNNADFLTYIKTQDNASNDNKKYSDIDVDNIKTEVASVLVGKQTQQLLDLLKNVDKWVKTQFATGTSYNFEVVDGLAKLVYSYGEKPTMSEKSALDTIYQYLSQNLWKNAKGDK
ncbi:HinT-interacting membrane complex protein P80 [Mycoplasma sp. 1932B]|uniref:HinT-interacting membrane complex protein P80 n=1 Tax=unclassified Mycoplasma TaxID=2683645 RepID=UPI003AAA41A5